jgi:Arc-like DNA binding domain
MFVKGAVPSPKGPLAAPTRPCYKVPSGPGCRMAGRHEAELKLRLGERLRRKIERAAARNNRSMNREILDRLEASFAADEGTRAGAAQAYRDIQYLTGMRERLDQLISYWAGLKKEDGEQK